MQLPVKRIVIYLVLPLALGALLGLSLKASEEENSQPAPVVVRRLPPPTLVGFKYITKDLPDDFNILLPVTKPASGLSVAVNFQDRKNFYLIKLSDVLAVVKVENGIPLPLVKAEYPADASDPYDIVIKRRSRKLTVVVNGTVSAEAYDGTFSRGAAMVSTTDCLDTPKIKVQRVGEVKFADNFMKVGDDASQWDEHSGTWRINTQHDSSMSSNAFFYTGRADARGSALSTAGYWFWDNYSFEASCKSEGTEYVGLCFYYRDSDNYFLFRWNANHPNGRKQLVKMTKGKMSVLAEQSGGYAVNQWYKMAVKVNGRIIRALIDGNLVLTAYDDNLAYGKIGLYNEGAVATRFDDAFARHDDSLFESFSPYPPSAWQQLGGTWSTCRAADASNGDYVLRAQVTATGKAVTGEDQWRNYSVTATVKGWQKGDVGLVARYLDEANHYLYSVSADGLHQLVKFSRGVREVLAEKKLPLQPDQPHELFLSIDNNILTAGINGQSCLEEWDATIKTGRAGLYASHTGAVDFDNVCVAMKRRGEPVLTINRIFSEEKTMAIWASQLSDWLGKRELIGGRRYTVSWHRADFPGDVEMSVRLGSAPAERADVRLAICADEQSLDSGYAMSVRNGGGLTLELFRRGKPVAAETVNAAEPIRVSLFKQGAFVIGMVNFEPVVKFKDEKPLEGVTAGIGQVGIDVPKENVQVTCPNVHVYTFDKAAADWRAASGAWQVSNRWECDPRWSFFSGKSKGDAVLWSKRMLKGDVTVEFAAGIKMDKERGGRYQYASDINATICADGQDLAAGYSFMYGGWENTATRIMRGNTVAAESKGFLIPNRQNIHRRWFYIKIRKRGSKLEYYIDNKLVLEYNDTEPLQGNRLAIWTHNNGLMVAKVRVSCLDGEKKEAAGFQPTRVAKSAYTR